MTDTTTNTNLVFHIAADQDVAAMAGSTEYQCPSLADEGFIHCCDRGQLPGVAQRYYQGMDALTLLIIDTDRLSPALIRENTVGGAELFPHIYGPINADAISEKVPFGLQSQERRAIDAGIEG